MASDQEKARSNNMVPSSREEYSCFEDQTTPHLVRQLQSFHHDHQSNNPTEIYNLTTSMEMINFPANTKNLDTNSILWKGFYAGRDAGGSSSSSKAVVTTINEPTASHDLYHHHQHQDQFNTKAGESNFMLMDDDQNDPSRSCHVFLCGANERPSQGLSLSLSSNNPSTIGLQSFQLRQQEHDEVGNDHTRFDHEFLGTKSLQHHQQVMQDGFMEKVGATNMLQYQLNQEGGHQFQIRNSKYLGPAQQLLNEFCNLGTTRKGHDYNHESKMQKAQKLDQWNQVHDENIGTSSSLNKHSLYSLEFLELQKRKTKLLQMLEEVDRRYKHYCDQMKAVVSSFEAVAGNGTATVYSAVASKTMSKHFRCLRDGIVGQIKATRKAMGEKDTAPPGGTRGETPRLRVLDQTLRQQRAFQQMNMMETHPWRPQRGLPERSVSVLRAWLFEHFLHPYPSDVDKHILARQTGLSRSQVSNWFINARVRLWKPMVEEMYVEETKEHENNTHGDNSPDHGAPNLDHDNNNADHLITHMNQHHEDHKPTQDQLVRIDSECLSSIINHPAEKNENKHFQDHSHHQHPQHHTFGRISDTFGAVELDFSAYNQQNNNFTGATGGVSLTLGLQQHGGLAFSPTSQSSLYYPREQIENCQQVHQVQYSSLLDAGEAQNLPYRNLMGAQLLHDLAG